MSRIFKIKSFFGLNNLKYLKHLLSLNKWRQLFRILAKKEKVIFFIFFSLFLSSFIFLSVNFYFKNTTIKPAPGGIHIEGIVGQPRFLNPIYAVLNDVDRDLVQLLFSGLMEYDEKGNLYHELAKEHKITEEGKVLDFYLRENILWNDGSPLTVDDIIFTIKTIQNPDYKSPLRAAWLGVEVEKISDKVIRFKLKNPSATFLENLTLKILPKHIWQDISPQNFPLTIYNLQPVGSGPFKLKEIKKDELGSIESLTLIRNLNYFGEIPKIQEVSFLFFEKEEDLVANLNKGEVKSLSIISTKNYDSLKKTGLSEHRLSLPRYFALFLNPEKSKILAEKEAREALNYGTNKTEILEKVLAGQGKIVNSPIIPEVYGFQLPSKIYNFDLEKAKDILEKAGFKEPEEEKTTTPLPSQLSAGPLEKIIKKEPAFQFKSDLKVGSRGVEVEELQKCLAKDSDIYPEGEITGFFGNSTKKAVIKFQEKYAKEILEPAGFKEGTGLVGKATRTKLNELCTQPLEEILPLKFTLTTVDQPILIEVANLLKEQWKNLGVELEIKKFNISTLEKEIIKKRDYESLLFGEVLGIVPDPFPFWHSSQKKDPGLNLALYENKQVDKLLEEARQTLDPGVRTQKYQEFQNLLIDDAPVIFLYNPDYIYFVSDEIKGIEVEKIADPSKRFIGIEKWYIQTKRVLK